MFGCLVCRVEQRGCDAFGLIPSPPAFPAAGCLPRSAAQLWVSMTGLDDLDNAASEEDDSCQGSVKLAFLPPVFFSPSQLSTVPGEETVSYDPPFLLWAPAPRLPARCSFVFLLPFFFFFFAWGAWLDSIFNGRGGSKMNKQRGGNSAHGK